MPRFVKLPVEIDAVQITTEMTVETLEGTMKGKPGDWLITGIKGERYFCDNDVFRRTYAPAGAPRALVPDAGSDARRLLE